MGNGIKRSNYAYSVLFILFLFPYPSRSTSVATSDALEIRDGCEKESPNIALRPICNNTLNCTTPSGSRCEVNYFINYPDHEIFRFSDTEELQVGLEILVDYPYAYWMYADVNSYCMVNNSSMLSAIFNLSNKNIRVGDEVSILFYCNICLREFEKFILHRRIHGVIKIIQGSVSLLTVLPYLILWKFQNATGWTQCSFFLALGLDCVFSGIYNFVYKIDLEKRTVIFCEITAAIIQIVEIACYSSWATGHYDMLRMVWTNNRIMRQRNIDYGRLMIYIFTGWGIPITIVSCEFLWNHFNRDMTTAGLHFDTDHFQRCLPPITTSLSTFIVQLTFIVASTIFFTTMFVLIRKHQQESQVAVETIEKRYGREVKTFVNLTIIVGLPFVAMSITELCLGETWAGTWYLVGGRLLLLGTVFYAFKSFGYNEKNTALFFRQYPKLKKFWASRAATHSSTQGSSGHH